MSKLLPLTLALLLLLSACTSAEADATPVPDIRPSASLNPESPAPTAAQPEDRWWEGVSHADLPSDLSPVGEIEAGSGRLYFLASLPEQELALYGYGGDTDGAPCGILLGSGSTLTHFEQVYLSAEHPALPELWWDDFDADGSGELAVNYLVSNTSSANVFELHIYEPQQDGSWSDHALLPEDYTAQLKSMIEYQYDADCRVVTASVPSGSAEFPLNDDEPEPAGAYPLFFLNRTFYRRDGGALTGVYGLGVMLNTLKAPRYFGLVTAEIEYDGDSFTLAHIALQSTLGV